MRRAKTARDLNTDADCLVHCERPGAKSLLEGLTTVTRHCDEQSSVVCLPNFMNGADVRMIEHRCCPRLSEQARLLVSVSAQMSGQKLEGDITIQPRVVRAKHCAHPAESDQRFDAIMADILASVKIGIG